GPFLTCVVCKQFRMHVLKIRDHRIAGPEVDADVGHFCLSDTAAAEIYTLSLHDALPISSATRAANSAEVPPMMMPPMSVRRALRSEEHTSELQSRFDLVCRLLLEKKNENSPPPNVWS